MNILIRKANLSDAQAIHSLIEGLAPLFIHQGDFNQLASFKLERYEEYLQGSRLAEYCFYVAIDSKKIIGVIALKYPAHLYHLYVAETYHRKGIATMLWHHLLHFQIHNQPEIKMLTVNSSLNAVALYTKFGFTRLTEGVEESNGIRFVPMKYLCAA